MASVSLQIYGFDNQLTTANGSNRAGYLPCITEIPSVTAAKWEPGDHVPSDQSSTIQVAVTESLIRRMLMQGGANAGIGGTSVNVRCPALPTDTRIYTTAAVNAVVGDKLWIAKECMTVTALPLVELTPNHRYYGYACIDVARGAGGTTPRRIDLPSDPSALGPLVVKDRPFDLQGCEVTLWSEREAWEPCINRNDPSHTHGVNPCKRPALHGVVTQVVDSGDMIQIDIQSGIESLVNTAWPSIPALHPFSNRLEQRISAITSGTRRYEIHPPFTGRVGWGANNGSSGIRYLSARHWDTSNPLAGATEILRDGIISTGPYAWIAAGGSREAAPASIAAYGNQSYTGIPRLADDYGSWKAIVVRGPDNYTGKARPSTDGREATDQEYILLSLEKTVDREVSPTPTALDTLSDLSDHNKTRTWTLGTYGYRITLENPSDLGATRKSAGYLYTHGQNSPYNQRSGRLDASPRTTDDRRIPGVIKPDMTVRCLGMDGLPGGFIGYWAAQWYGESPYIIDAHHTPSPRVIDKTNASLLRFLDAWIAISGALATEAEDYQPFTRMFGYSDWQAWLPEVWLGRTLGETLFQDLFLLTSISWAPGRGGTIRPIPLFNLPAPTLTIGPEHVRDRDATVQQDYSSVISRVTVTDLRTSVIYNEDADTSGTPPYGDGDDVQKGYGPTPDTIDIVSSESVENGIQGKVIKLKASPYHNRLNLPLMDPDPDLRNPYAIHRTIEWCWTRAVQNFSKPCPKLTLVIDGDLEVWPGDVVTVSLPNLPTRTGIGGSIRAIVLERGDSLDVATAEVTFLLIGWYD